MLRYQRQQQYQAHTDHCSGPRAGETASPACRAFLARGGGPACGEGGGGVTCGDRLATFIMYLR